MSTSTTSVGRGPAHGSNENHDGDPTHITMGEGASPEDPPAGNDLLEQAASQLPDGRPGEHGPAGPGAARGLPPSKQR